MLFKINDGIDIEYFKELQIDFKKIKSLKINTGNNNVINSNYFFEILFFEINLNNLVYLNLDSFTKSIDENGNILLSQVNNLKSLEILILSKFKFDNVFKLYMDNLKVLNISFCENILLSQNMCLKLKKLYIIISNIKSNKLLKFPEVEECYLNSSTINVDFRNIIIYSEE